MMAAALTPSLLLLLVHSLTADQDLGGPGPSDSGGPETCKSPVTIWSSLTVSPSKLWYDRGERLQVMCSEGYRPSTSVIECRQQGQSSASEWNVTVTCIQRCKNPNTGWSVLILAPSKEWYDRGERVQVTCAAGYKPSTSTFECRQRLWGSASEWDVTPSCIQKCQKPIIGGSALRFSPSKEWYDRGEWVYVTCVEGYQTLTPSILCREKDVSSLSEWNETPTCIEIKRTRLGVSSSSVTLTLTCGNDDCRSFWETSATWYQNSCCANRCPPHVLYQECAIEAQDNRTKETAVTCAGLLPVTEYIVAVYGVRKQPSPDRHYLLYNVTVTTNETVPDAPEIEWFNATTKTIKWKELSECSGTIQEYQLNITAWSDYNKTFLETEFVTVNSSVTEYTVERYDTNYKARIRGLTSAGLGKALTWTFTTKISGSSNEDQQPVAQEESLEPSLSSMDEVSVSPMDESGATPVILAKEEKVRGYPNHVKAFQDIQKSIHTIQERLEKKMDSLVGVINVLNQNVIQVIGSQQNLTRDLSTALSRFTDVLKDSQLISSNSGLFSKKATGPLPTASTNTVEQKGGSEDAQ